MPNFVEQVKDLLTKSGWSIDVKVYGGGIFPHWYVLTGARGRQILVGALDEAAAQGNRWKHPLDACVHLYRASSVEV